MQLIIKEQGHIESEIYLHHNLNFSKCLVGDVNDRNEKNIISVTADLDGFTTLKQVCVQHNWSEEAVKLEADHCNEIDQSVLVRAVAPTIFMIPKSDLDDAIIKYPEYYISELLKVADYYKTDQVHFTHYSFIKFFPKGEIIRQLTILLNPVRFVPIKNFYWEIDSRFTEEMIETYKYVIKEIFRREPKKLEVITSRVRNIVDKWETFGNGKIAFLEP